MERSDTKILHSTLFIPKGDFLELGIWELFVICYLLFVICYLLFVIWNFRFIRVRLAAVKMGKLHRKSPPSLGSGAQ
jgi:hypothetical protein